jgi:hypothetical protein
MFLTRTFGFDKVSFASRENAAGEEKGKVVEKYDFWYVNCY